jgi:hypothetical protein
MPEEEKKSFAETVDAFFTDEVMELVRRSYTKPITMEDLRSGRDGYLFDSDDAARAYRQFYLSLYTYLETEKSMDKNILHDAIWEKYHYLHSLLKAD